MHCFLNPIFDTLVCSQQDRVMSPCDATLRLFLDGFLALTQDMKEGPCYSTP